MKTAIVLMNLGGPARRADIAPFLFSFFMDKNIIAAPWPVRAALAKWISWSRSRGAANTSYAALGYRSPLLDNTRAQAVALQALLPEARVFVSMRHWHPRADRVVREVAAYDPDAIVLLPLYPQFSTTTVKSALEDWRRAAAGARLKKPTREICCWPVNAGFIRASADNIRQALKKAPANTRLLLSAHGLPEKIIAAGDPYQRQCDMTAEAIVKELNMPGLDWQVCYQSRVGPLKWTGPSIGEALEKVAADKKSVLVYAHAFVSEHVETLVEIDIQYKARALALGIPWFGRAPAVSTHPDFIRGLAEMVSGKAGAQPCAECGWAHK